MLKNNVPIQVALVLLAVAGCATTVSVAAQATAPKDSSVPPANDSSTPPAHDTEPAFRVESIRGRVVWYGDALREQFGIQTVKEASQRVLALATKDGQLLPLMEDLRGRAFRSDQRLREMEVELRVRRYEATPALQILRVFEWRDGVKYRVDYWCDVCAIVMFETGPCSCCQDHNRLRRQKVE